MTSDRLATLLLRIARGGQGEAFDAGLNPAQWAALRYFARANRFSRSVSAFARFHGTSRGTAAQSVRALEAKGLVTRCREVRDRRAVAVCPSGAGLALLERDPLRRIELAIDALGEDLRSALATSLDALRRQLSDQVQSFGRCADCDCLASDGDGHPYCRAAGERLAEGELEHICAGHVPAGTGAVPVTAFPLLPEVHP